MSVVEYQWQAESIGTFVKYTVICGTTEIKYYSWNDTANIELIDMQQLTAALNTISSMIQKNNISNVIKSGKNENFSQVIIQHCAHQCRCSDELLMNFFGLL